MKKISPNPSITLLQVIPSMAFGGAEIQTLQQINYLHQAGIEVYLVVLSEIHEFPIPIRFPKNRIEVLHFEYDSLTFNAIKKCFSLVSPLLQLLQKRQITHVIAQLPLSHFVMRLVKIRQQFTNKTNTSFQLFNYHRAIQYKENPLDTLGKKAFNRFNNQLARRTDTGNIFVSQAAFDNISKHLFIRNPKIIHNVVAENRTDASLALQYLQNHELKSVEFLMVLPGRVLAEVKGHRLLIAAFQELKQKYQWKVGEVRVVFAGGGRSIPALKEEIRTADLSNYFLFTDFIPNPLLLSFLRLANVVVIPSIAEGFGNVAVEALMQQSTIVCSDAGGLKEIITDGFNGWVFESESIAALAQKLAFVYENRHQNMLDKEVFLKDYRERFTVEAQKEKLVEFVIGEF
ncbi:MAG: glycosyltransferase family 4 protein [Chitinophagales bacterium]